MDILRMVTEPSPFTFKGLCVLPALFALSPVCLAVDLGIHKGCAASDQDFEVTTVTTGNKILKMAFDARPDNGVDIYLAGQAGTVQKYDGVLKSLITLGTVPGAAATRGDNGSGGGSIEDGLVGIALDPGFGNNRTLYFMYSSTSPDTAYRVARMKLGADERLDPASHKILITIPNQQPRWHTGGAMAFDSYGDLYVAVGDNMAGEPGPGNTADLRGSILRIHPDEGAEAGYTIPEGNFSHLFAERFRAAGNAAMSELYQNPAKVRPELYVKGVRNPYTLTLDPVRRWLSWGCVGPDYGAVSEETNLVKEASYTGWPYFAGVYNTTRGFTGQAWTAKVRATPVNLHPGNSGVQQLPANTDPVYVRRQACAMTGPIFRYDGSNPSPIQFPPQLNRKWLVSDCNAGFGFHLLTLDEAGEKVLSDVPVFSQAATSNLIDLQAGPDGAIYYLNNGGSAVHRIQYKGMCRDPSLLPEQAPTFVRRRQAETDRYFRTRAGRVSPQTAGPHELRILDLQGRLHFEVKGRGRTTYSLPTLPED